MESNTKNNSWLVPVAIIIAGVLIAGAVVLSGHNDKGQVAVKGDTTATGAQPEITFKPVTDTDHILGSKNAKITIVEYSDLECPFCKQFQNTLHQALTEYGKNNDVAWVFRHFTVHSKAPHEAEASECVAELGGNDKFFQYIDKIFAVTKSDNNLDPKILTSTAVSLGIDQTKFQSCLDSGKYTQLVANQTQDAVNAGGEGTPFTILVTKDSKYPINGGAIPYAQLKSIIDSVLAEQ